MPSLMWVLNRFERTAADGYRFVVSTRSTQRLLLLGVTMCVGLVTIATATAATRKPAPATAGPTVNGGKASLAALRGTPVFINVWSSW